MIVLNKCYVRFETYEKYTRYMNVTKIKYVCIHIGYEFKSFGLGTLIMRRVTATANHPHLLNNRLQIILIFFTTATANHPHLFNNRNCHAFYESNSWLHLHREKYCSESYENNSNLDYKYPSPIDFRKIQKRILCACLAFHEWIS